MLNRGNGQRSMTLWNCSEKEQNVIDRVQRTYREKYNSLAMFDSKREASGLLHEYVDEQVVQKLKREQHRKIQSEHTHPKSEKNELTLNVKQLG